MEQTQQVKSTSKLGYDQILAETGTEKSSSSRQGASGQESTRTVNRTNERTTSGGKESSASATGRRTSTEKVNLGFRITFTVPFTGITPTPKNSNSC